MRISQDPTYQTAKASVWYWQKQQKNGRECAERIAWWTYVLETIRDTKRVATATKIAAVASRRRIFRIPHAKMPRPPRQVVKEERDQWVPVRLCWD
jgi:hypothetical protein